MTAGVTLDQAGEAEDPLAVLGKNAPWPVPRAFKIATAEPAAPGVTLGKRTAADLAFLPPGPQLCHPYIAPDGHTLLYGPGGVGKGTTAAWLIKQLVEAGHEVYLLDFEYHENEWGYRLRGLGMTEDQMRHVHYRSPGAPEWTAKKGTLLDVAEIVRDDCTALGVTVLVVDSVSYATSVGDKLGGIEGPQEYFAALNMIGLPSLSLAHVKGGSERFPDRPFGSVYWRNGARELWAVEAVTSAAQTPDEVEAEALGVATVALELRNTKKNFGSGFQPQFLTFEYTPDHAIAVSTERQAGTRLWERLRAILAGHPWLSTKQLNKALKDNYQLNHDPDIIRKTLVRKRDCFKSRDADGATQWALTEHEEG